MLAEVFPNGVSSAATPCGEHFIDPDLLPPVRVGSGPIHLHQDPLARVGYQSGSLLSHD